MEYTSLFYMLFLYMIISHYRIHFYRSTVMPIEKVLINDRLRYSKVP